MSTEINWENVNQDVKEEYQRLAEFERQNGEPLARLAVADDKVKLRYEIDRLKRLLESVRPSPGEEAK